MGAAASAVRHGTPAGGCAGTCGYGRPFFGLSPHRGNRREPPEGARSPEVLMMLTKLAAPLVLAVGCVAFAAPSHAQPAAFGGPKMLIHGNYCGPGNNAPLPPIDALDAACARHDACTPEGGLPSQACNLRLQREATLISRDPRQPQDLRSLAGLIAATATLIPSDPDARSVPAAVTTDPPARGYAPVLSRTAPPIDADEDPDGADAD
jgi:hypothetical protein